MTSDTEFTLREFWKDHFTAVYPITLADNAWRNLWPEAVTERDFEAVPIVEDIVSLGKSMGLDV